MGDKGLRSFYVLFFLSGCTSLAYELVFYKLLGYVFGASTLAMTTVLVAFMGGLALGGRLIGAWADRVRRPIALYGALELAIGAYVLLVPLLLSVCTDVYVALGISADVRSPGHVVVRCAISVAVLLLPTVLMGGTLPLLAAALVKDPRLAERDISRLYGINTLGAAFGTLVANYVLLRCLGVWGTLAAGAAANAFIFRRARRLQEPFASPPPALLPPSGAFAPADGYGAPLARRAFPLVALTAFATGFLSFLYEIVWTHLLATIVGSSVYAFGLMLFTFLFGIALGSLLLARWRPAQVPRLELIAALQLLLGGAVLLTVPLWDELPRVFTAAAVLLPGFYTMEAIRMAVCLAMLLLPCVAIGATFPLLLRIAVADHTRIGRRVGILYSVNTLGCIAGAVATGCYLLARFGSERLLALGGGGSLVLGLACAFVAAGRQRFFRRSLALATAVAALAALFPRWDLRALVSGTNVYFDRGAKASDLIYAAEDAQGGFTTVTRESSTLGTGLTLRTNGKFQGDDFREVEAQYGFALVPLLFVPRFDAALVIGYGTGSTAGVLGRFPFRSIEIAELSGAIVEASRRYFDGISFGVLRDPRVRLAINDGRNHLLVSKARYDLVTIELTSIWFAGAGNLYNKEFYELCRRRLTPGGVLQQWVQLHHIDRIDLLVLWNTVRQVFPYVSLWTRGGQGILVATEAPQVVRYAHVHTMNTTPAAAPLKAHMNAPDFFSLLGDQVLDPEAMDRALGQLRGWIGATAMPLAVSRDSFPYLEYATPMGNALPWAREANAKWIEGLDGRRLPLVTGVPGQAARLRIAVLAAHRRSNCDRALRLLARWPDGTKDGILADIEQECARMTDRTDY